MKTAEISAEPRPDGSGYVWRWREGAVMSRSFDYYYECLDDARSQGYTVQLERATGENAPDRTTGSGMK
jgi:hypothetical protein